MNLDIWLAFTAAAAVLIAIPGPTTLIVLGHTLAGGRALGFVSLAGVAAGDMCAIGLSVLGFSAVLSASAASFEVLKWAGAAYLVWLGIGLWRAPAAAVSADPERGTSACSAIWRSFAVTLLNPKGVLFFTAFLPQFIDPERPLFGQVAALTLTFNVLATAIQGGYVLAAGRARHGVVSERAMRRLNRAGGAMLVGAGLLTATLKRG
ncbi:MAG: LysE family translocator [Alphaproteobacteria bacterium]|nr:LysE family translocator [Alphaproteobacteria bacterium]